MNKIAVTCENQQVFQHFGHTPEFAIFETDGKTVLSEKILPTGEIGHGALAGLLAEEGVQLLLCGGIGGGAVNALTCAGIKVIGGVDGNVREVVEALLNGTLKNRSDFFCSHHHQEGHTCQDGDHHCGTSCH